MGSGAIGGVSSMVSGGVSGVTSTTPAVGVAVGVPVWQLARVSVSSKSASSKPAEHTLHALVL